MSDLPIRPSSDPRAVHRLHVPFGIKLLLAFLLMDGLERLGEVVGLVAVRLQGGGFPDMPFVGHPALLVLWTSIDLILALLIAFRSYFGRTLTQLMLTFHLGYLANLLVVNNPEVWLYGGTWGRVQWSLTLICDVFFVVYLLSYQARSYLNQ